MDKARCTSTGDGIRGEILHYASSCICAGDGYAGIVVVDRALCII